MKSIGSTGAQWRASLRQPNNRMSSVSKRLAALNQRGVIPNRRTFVFHGSKNRTQSGSYRQQNSCDFASLGASLTSEVTPCKGGDSIAKLAKRHSSRFRRDDLVLRKSSDELIGVTPPPIQEISELSPEPQTQPEPLTEVVPLDEDDNPSDPLANTRKFLENYRELVFCCNVSAPEGIEIENTENKTAADSEAGPATSQLIENMETVTESIVVENHSSEKESPCNPTPLVVEQVTNADSILKSTIAEPHNSILENTAMVTVSIKNPTDQISTAPETKPIKSKSVSRKRRLRRRPEKITIFQSDPLAQDDSGNVRYRKLFYSEPEHKWVQHLILEEEDAPSDESSKSKDEVEKFVLPHLVKGRQTDRFKQWLPTAFIKSQKNRCFYDKIHVTDELRMELHKRKMPIVGSYFQEHIFKFGKLPFRNNPRSH